MKTHRSNNLTGALSLLRSRLYVQSMGRSASHLTYRKGRGWYAVKRVPEDIRAHLNRQALWQALNTHDAAVAAQRRDRVLDAWQCQFQKLRRGRLRPTNEDLRAIRDATARVVFDAWVDRGAVAGAAPEAVLAALVRERDERAANLGFGADNWDQRRRQAVKIAERRGWVPNDSTVTAIATARLGGQISGTQGFIAGIEPPTPRLANADTAFAALVPTKRRSTTWQPVRDAVAAFVGSMEPGAPSHRSIKTASHYRYALARFADHFGEVQIGDVARADVTAHIRTLQNALGLAPKTVNRHVAALAALFRWAKQSGLCADNPAQGQRIAEPAVGHNAFLPFATAELKAILRPPTESRLDQSSDAVAVYWVSLIAAFSGMRLSEICRLRIADLRELQRVPFFHVETPRATRTRQVPIHAALLRAGLMAYAAQVKGPWLLPDTAGQSRDMGKRFLRHRRALGITRPRLGFQSFRTGIAEVLARAGVHADEIAMVMGTAVPRSASRASESVDLRSLQRVIAAIDYPFR